MKRRHMRMLMAQLRRRFLLALIAFAAACAVLTALFPLEWHRHGDTFAMVLAALFPFFASVITVMVTLTYLHVSHRMESNA